MNFYLIQLNQTLFNHLHLVIQILVAPTLNANRKTEPSIVCVPTIMSAILTVHVVQNVCSIRTVLVTKVVPVTDVSIHALELAESTPIVEWQTTFLFAVAKKPLLEILMVLVDLYLSNVRFLSNKRPFI